MNLSSLENELKTLPLDEIQWELFLKVLSHLYKHQQISKTFIALRWNVDSKTVDRIATSLTRLQWVYYSLGDFILSDRGSEILERLKTGNYRITIHV